MWPVCKCMGPLRRAFRSPAARLLPAAFSLLNMACPLPTDYWQAQQYICRLSVSAEASGTLHEQRIEGVGFQISLSARVAHKPELATGASLLNPLETLPAPGCRCLRWYKAAADTSCCDQRCHLLLCLRRGDGDLAPRRIETVELFLRIGRRDGAEHGQLRVAAPFRAPAPSPAHRTALRAR